MPSRKVRTRGFALPMVILAMFVLVGAIAAGFAMLSSERSADDSSTQARVAAALAESGLQRALRERRALGLTAVPRAGEAQQRIDFDGEGYALVTTHVLRDTSMANGYTGLYFVQSRGVATRASSPLVREAVVVVGTFATFVPMRTNVTAALGALNGVRVNSLAGNSAQNGYISGINECSLGGSQASISAPPGSVILGSGVNENQSLLGDPRYDDITTRPLIDWDDISSPSGSISHTVLATVNPGGSPSTWPAVNTEGIFLRQETVKVINRGGVALRLPTGTGKGLLIVQGDLTIGGNANWDGIILVGGKLTFSGGQLIKGAVMTGLNALLTIGAMPPANELDDSDLNGAVRIQYNSCLVLQSMTAFGSLQAIGKTWVNTLPTY